MTTITQIKTMKAALYYEPGVVRYENIEIPTPKAGELLVKIEAALTCGTDVKCYRRGHPVLLKDFPSRFGHEFSGVVAALGEGVDSFEIGDRVVSANSAPCYHCYFCEKEQYNLCESLDLLNGAYAEYIVIPERIVQYNTLKLPDTLPFEIAAFTEPLANAVRAIEISGIQPGDSVAVLGPGPIGQLIIKCATLAGANVTVFGRSELKLAMAKSFGGATEVLVLSSEADAQAIRNQHTPNGRGFDVVIEAIGQPHTWQLAVEMVRRGGLVNFFGGCASGTQVSLDTRRLHYDEIKLVSPFHYTPNHFKQALDLLSSGQIDPTPLITERLPMAEFEQALQLMEAGKALKIALKP